jgi:hypothetical protein
MPEGHFGKFRSNSGLLELPCACQEVICAAFEYILAAWASGREAPELEPRTAPLVPGRFNMLSPLSAFDFS